MREKDGKSKGCAFVRYHSQHAADMACAALNGTMALPGCVRALVVKYADTEPRSRQQSPNSVVHMFPPGMGGDWMAGAMMMPMAAPALVPGMVPMMGSPLGGQPFVMPSQMGGMGMMPGYPLPAGYMHSMSPEQVPRPFSVETGPRARPTRSPRPSRPDVCVPLLRPVAGARLRLPVAREPAPLHNVGGRTGHFPKEADVAR